MILVSSIDQEIASHCPEDSHVVGPRVQIYVRFNVANLKHVDPLGFSELSLQGFTSSSPKKTKIAVLVIVCVLRNERSK